MDWNFQKIEYFLRVTEEKSLSEAARKMFFTPQALNKNLRQLEEELGVKLINRERGAVGSGDKMSLTLAGEQLKECFMSCFREYQEAISRMETYLHHRKQKLKLAYFRGIKKNEILMPLFQYLSEREEFESIELLSGELGEVLEWTDSEGCDVGITSIHEAERKRDNIQYIPVHRSSVKIVISDNHIWAGKKCVTVEEMAQETMVIIKWNEELEKDNFWKTVPVKERKMVSDMDTMLAEVKTGKYFCVICGEFEGDYDKSFMLLDLPQEYAFSSEVCVVYKKGNYFQGILDKIARDSEKIWKKDRVLEKQQ